MILHQCILGFVVLIFYIFQSCSEIYCSHLNIAKIVCFMEVTLYKDVPNCARIKVALPLGWRFHVQNCLLINSVSKYQLPRSILLPLEAFLFMLYASSSFKNVGLQLHYSQKKSLNNFFSPLH